MPVRQRAALVILLAVAYWALIFVLTHLPGMAPKGGGWLDKFQHAGAFGGLAFLLCAAWTIFRPPGLLMAAAVIGIAATYGALDELTQMLVPRRSADVRDWIADVVGATLGVMMFLIGWRLVHGRATEVPHKSPRQA